jgi:hypothetical protein
MMAKKSGRILRLLDLNLGISLIGIGLIMVAAVLRDNIFMFIGLCVAIVAAALAFYILHQKENYTDEDQRHNVEDRRKKVLS